MQMNVLPPFGVLHRYNIHICNMWFEEQAGETTQLLLKHNSTFNF